MIKLADLFRKKASRTEVEETPQSEIKVHHEEGGDSVSFWNLRLNRDNGEQLIDFGSVTLKPGDKMMLSGPSGCGKSSGLCAMKGAWLSGGTGGIVLPPDNQIKFVPQEDYFPDCTLRGIICAPHSPSSFTDEQVKAAMTEAGLSEFIAEMDDEKKRGEHWKNKLSGGQKKKVAIASVFLHASMTKVLILDEVTSALDPQSEKELYPKIMEKMQHGIVISVVHRQEIARHHNIFATVENGTVSYSKAPKTKPFVRILTDGLKQYNPIHA